MLFVRRRLGRESCGGFGAISLASVSYWFYLLLQGWLPGVLVVLVFLQWQEIFCLCFASVIVMFLRCGDSGFGPFNRSSSGGLDDIPLPSSPFISWVLRCYLAWGRLCAQIPVFWEYMKAFRGLRALLYCRPGRLWSWSCLLVLDVMMINSLVNVWPYILYRRA